MSESMKRALFCTVVAGIILSATVFLLCASSAMPLTLSELGQLKGGACADQPCWDSKWWSMWMDDPNEEDPTYIIDVLHCFPDDVQAKGNVWHTVGKPLPPIVVGYIEYREMDTGNCECGVPNKWSPVDVNAHGDAYGPSYAEGKKACPYCG